MYDFFKIFWCNWVGKKLKKHTGSGRLKILFFVNCPSSLDNGNTNEQAKNVQCKMCIFQSKILEVWQKSMNKNHKCVSELF